MPEEFEGRLSWIKSHVREELYTDVGELKTPEELWVWHGLKLLAADSPVFGVICIKEGIPYSEYQMAELLHVTEEACQRTIDKLMKAGKLTLNGHKAIEIVDFDHYAGRTKRTEYQRNYMKNVYRPRKRIEKQQESKPNGEPPNSNVVHVSHDRRDETRREEDERIDETRREEDENDRGIVDIHEKYFGLIGFPNEKLMDTFKALSAYPQDQVEEKYQEAAAMSPPPRYPAGYVLAALKGTGRRKRGEKQEERLDPTEYVSGRLGHLIHH